MEIRMKVFFRWWLSLALVIGCSSGGDEPGSGSGAPAPTGGAGTGAAGFSNKPSPAGAAAVAGDSFFAGEVPAAVKMKPTKSFAIGPGILLIQGVEGWTGGKLPGYDYMATNKDSTAVFRVTTSTGVTGQMGCKEIGTAAAMAPARAKNLKETSAPVMRRVGKNNFVAREGTCSADGPNGPVEIRFVNILRKDKDGLWHYAVLVSYPQGASQDVRNEAMAMARSLEYNGENGYTMP
jgi:hypothetical protein